MIPVGTIRVDALNRWLGTHKTHPIRFYRRRAEDMNPDEEGFPLPQAAAVAGIEIVVLTCDQCHRGLRVCIEGEEDSTRRT